MMQTAHLHTITNLRALKPLLLLLILCSWSNLFAQTYNGTTWYSAKPGNFTIYTIGSSEFNVFPPSTGSITFTYQYKKADLTGWFPNFDVKIYCYVGGYGSAIDACSGSAFKTYSAKTVSGLNAEATKVKFDRPTGNTHNVAFSDIKLPMAPHIRLKSSNNANGVTEQTLTDFANTIWGTTCSDANRKTVYFRSFLTGNNNANANITITSSNPEVFRVNGANSTAAKVFNVGKNAFAYESGSGTCSAGKAGKVSNYTFNVYFHPTEAKEYTGTITITDGVSTAYVYVKGTGIKRGQTIQDFPTGTATAKTTDVIDFDAYTTDNVSSDANGLSVSYSSDNGAVATINSATGVVDIKTSGTVTFTATQAGTNDSYGYNSTSKSITYTISKVTPDVTWPKIADDLVYIPGAKVKDHWTIASPVYAVNDKGATITGTFTCEDELQPAKNGTGEGSGYSVIFTPDQPIGKDWYNSTSETIYKDVAKADQEITWGDNLTDGQEYASGVEMDAVASSGLEVNYAITNVDESDNIYATIVTVDDKKVLHVETPKKEIIITASQAGNANWNAAEPKSKTIKTCRTKPDTYEVTARGIIYGQKLGESELIGTAFVNGSSIGGKWKWVDSEIGPDAGTYNYKAYFDPENKDAFDTITRPVSVTIDQADPVFECRIGNELRANMHYYNFFSTSSKGGITPSYVSDEGLSLSFEDDGYTLVTGNVTIEERKKTGTITIKQAETQNYNSLDTTLEVTVYTRPDVCVPVALAEDNPEAETTMTDMRVGSDNSSWCNASQDGEGQFEVKERIWPYITTYYDVKYTQSVGIALGTWRDGFTGLTWDKIGTLISEVTYNITHQDNPKPLSFSWAEKSIELAFTGVPDKISFSTELQKVKFEIMNIWSDYYEPTAPKWELWEKASGGVYTRVNVDMSEEGTPVYTDVQLKEETRCVKIVYSGNFAGFIKGLTITRKDPYIIVKDGLQPDEFGTKTHPLQQPQLLKIKYASIGACKEEGRIDVSTTGPFYVDKSSFIVNMDEIGEQTIRVRCNDVDQNGTVIFKDQDDNPLLTVNVSSANPVIDAETATDGIFQTGTEHAPSEGTEYRALQNHNFAECFNGSTPRFDYIYIYGVTESSASDRLWSYDAKKDYDVPVINVAEGNVHTPCFVYKKNITETAYEYVRTFDAATTTSVISTGNKIAFKGYKPADLTKSIPAIRINGGTRELYLDSTEIMANEEALELNGVHSIYARLSNSLTSKNAVAVKFIAASTKLIVNDNWASATSGYLALNSKSGKPSIVLNNANDSVIIRGSQLKLQNGSKMAIALIDTYGNETHEGAVRISDGTILGPETLGLPFNTLIDGGTFNDGTVKVYNKKGIAKRPKNKYGELLERRTMYEEDLVRDFNWYGHNHLTPDGLGRIHPMLLDESVYVFDGGPHDSLATNPENWNLHNVPEPNSDAYITAPVVITDTLTLNSLTIKEGEGITVTIAPTGGLTIGEDGIFGATKDNLILKADSAAKSETKGMTGFLRIDPEFEEGMPEATVELFSKAYYDYNKKLDDIAQWQYVGSPLASKDVAASSVFKMSWIYSWDEENEQWKNERASLKLTPFVGYATTQRFYSNGALLTYKGQLVSNRTDVNINLAWSGEKKGRNVLANSFTAPIDITKFEDGDFVNCDSVIYLFNTGSRRDAKNANADANAKKSYDVAGQYLHIPIGSARLLKGYFGLPTIIAPMQGFYIHATNADAHITLNYSKLVWTGDYKNNPNTPLHSPKRTKRDEEEVGALQISLYANGGADNLYILESEQFDAYFENGMDARKLMGEGLNIFTIEDNEQLGVDATNSLIGTRVGVRTNEETAYTMLFSHLQSEDELALLDNETNQTTDIYEGTEYTFYAEPNSEILGRFQIVERAKAPATPTGVDGTETGVKVHKFIKDNQLYILKNGVLYNGMGAVVR